MKHFWGAFIITCVLGLVIVGFQADQSQAAPLYDSRTGIADRVTNTITTEKEASSRDIAPQVAPLLLSLRVTKPAAVYLTEEPIEIRISSNYNGVRITLEAVYTKDNEQQTETIISSEKIAGERTELWSNRNAVTGNVKLTCTGDITVVIRRTCTDCGFIGKIYTCWSYDCSEYYPLNDSKETSLVIYPRYTSISGKLTDKNNKPVAGASVSITSVKTSATADSNGFYRFDPYRIGDNYQLDNQVPTIADAISIDAVACKPVSKNNITIKAGQPASADLTLERYFYPPNVNLAKFTFDIFKSWNKASEYSTWQDILGITVGAGAKMVKLHLGSGLFTKEVPFESFDIDNKKLYLITKPQNGRYFLDISSDSPNTYDIAAAATLGGNYLTEAILPIGIEKAGSLKRIPLVFDKGVITLKPPPEIDWLVWVIPPIVGIAAGALIAYFVLTGKFLKPKKAPAGQGSAETKKISSGKKLLLESGKKTDEPKQG